MTGPPTLRNRPLVTLSGIEKRYAAGTIALTDVNLEIGQPEFISLVGPSGCGKSTILRLLAGLGAATGGRIVWHDTPPAPAGGPRQRDIGFVFQDPTLMPWATVEDNVGLGLSLNGAMGPDAMQRRDTLLATVGLARFAHAYPRELSGGMRMRASLARALLTRPPLLLMDEPFAALDEITRFELIEELLALWQDQPWTVVFVTHSVFESVYMSQRVAVMSSRPGTIVREIIIDEPLPRTPAFRGTARYAGYCRDVSEALRQAHAQGAG